MDFGSDIIVFQRGDKYEEKDIINFNGMFYYAFIDLL